MTLAANTNLDKRTASQLNGQAVNAATVFGGGYQAIGGRDHATAASRGRIEPYTGAVGHVPAGFALQQLTGDTSLSPIPRAEIDTETMNVLVTVAGLAGDRTDVTRLVYATADDTFTFTRPARGIPVGIVEDFRDTTNAWVRFFSFTELAVLALAGSGKFTWFLGTIAPVLTAGGDMLTGIVAPVHGRITDIYGIVVRQATDADVDIDVNLEIGGTNVTGGVVEYLFSDAVAAKKAGTAITAANVIHEGDLVDVEGVVNAAGTATDPGLMNLYAEVELDLGV